VQLLVDVMTAGVFDIGGDVTARGGGLACDQSSIDQ